MVRHLVARGRLGLDIFFQASSYQGKPANSSSYWCGGRRPEFKNPKSLARAPKQAKDGYLCPHASGVKNNYNNLSLFISFVSGAGSFLCLRRGRQRRCQGLLARRLAASLLSTSQVRHNSTSWLWRVGVLLIFWWAFFASRSVSSCWRRFGAPWCLVEVSRRARRP